MEHRSCGTDHAPFTDCPTGPWAVFDANVDPERRIAVGGSKECAEELRRLNLHVTPDADPSWVYLATAEL